MRWKVDELYSAAGYYKRSEIYGFSKGDFPDSYLYKERCRQKELVVEDNGVGISPGDIGRVFEKGFTGANGRAADKNSLMASTGMGLYLCRKLCEKWILGSE